MTPYHQRKARGWFLRALREETGLTARDLADRTQKSAGAVSNYETGKRDLDVSDAMAFAKALEVPVAALVEPWRLTS